MAEELSQETYRLMCDRNMGIEGLLFEEVVVEDINGLEKLSECGLLSPMAHCWRGTSPPSLHVFGLCSRNMTRFFPSSVL